MPFMDMFSFVSPEEQKRREREFQKKVFPLGLEQKNLALNALRPLINPKIRDQELLFAFILSKQKYVETSDQDATCSVLGKQRLFSETERSYIMALILLDASAESLSEYPSATDVKLKAGM